MARRGCFSTYPQNACSSVVDIPLHVCMFTNDRSDCHSYPPLVPNSTLWQLTSHQTTEGQVQGLVCGQDSKRPVYQGWRRPWARSTGCSPNCLRAKRVPPTAFYLNSGLFLISFRSENYSSDHLERLVYLFSRQLLPWWEWAIQNS